MSTFNTILDPISGKRFNIYEKKGREILQKYSDISGRTKTINNTFFQFREHEFLALSGKIYPFLENVLAQNEISNYINKFLNTKSCSNHMDEVNIKDYMDCFTTFEKHIDQLITQYNSIKNNQKNIRLNVKTDLLEYGKI
tara:strand:+ start:300 stop:719 length:420 start_codon:yes stop_codon:yes gene_type:complete